MTHAPSPFRPLTVAGTTHLFAPGSRTSICGQVVNARRLQDATPAARRCGHCTRPIHRCATCGRAVQRRADGTAKRHHGGARFECRGSGETPVMVKAVTIPEKPRGGRVYLDDVDHLLSYHLTLETIAERLGVKVESIQQALRRREKREAEGLGGERGAAA